MKKYFVTAAVVIAAVAGVTCYNYESDNELSDLAKKNVKALAGDKLENYECIPPYTYFCGYEGSIRLPGVKYKL